MTKDCCLGEICLRIKNTSNMENFNLRAGRPVKIYLPMEQPEKMTAMYMFNPWWTRPAFIESFQEIPDRTQVLFMKYPDYYACMVPMVGKKLKPVYPEERRRSLPGYDSRPGRNQFFRRAFVSYIESFLFVRSPYIRHLYGSRIIKGSGSGKNVGSRKCSGIWAGAAGDAFYREVSEKGIRRKAEGTL